MIITDALHACLKLSSAFALNRLALQNAFEPPLLPLVDLSLMALTPSRPLLLFSSLLLLFYSSSPLIPFSSTPLPVFS